MPPQRDGQSDDETDRIERRRQPELNKAGTVEKKAPIDKQVRRFGDDEEDDSARMSRMNRVMRGVARQVLARPNDGMDLWAPMTKPSKKQRLSVYLDPDVMKALAVYAARRSNHAPLIAGSGHRVPSCRRRAAERQGGDPQTSRPGRSAHGANGTTSASPSKCWPSSSASG